MFKITLDVKDNTDTERLVQELKKHKEIKKITVPRQKPAKKMSGFYSADGNELPTTDFNKRIKKAEKNMKNGEAYNTGQMLQLHKQWKKKHNLMK